MAATHPNISEYIGITPESEFDLAQIVENGLPVESLSLLKEKGFDLFRGLGDGDLASNFETSEGTRGSTFLMKRRTGWCGWRASLLWRRTSSVILKRHCCGYGLRMIVLRTAAH